jgi:hypothetical protein
VLSTRYFQVLRLDNTIHILQKTILSFSVLINVAFLKTDKIVSIIIISLDNINNKVTDYRVQFLVKTEPFLFAMMP